MLTVIQRITVAVALACLGCWVVVCGPACAAPTWLVPTNLSAAGQNASAPRIAVDQQGDAVAVWERSNGSNDVVQASVRPVGAGAWQPAVDLSAAGANTQYATVGSDARGDAVAVWQSYDGTEYTVWAAIRPVATGTWQTPVQLSALGVFTMTPQVAVDPQGDAIVVWTYYDDIDHHFFVQADRRLAGGGWEAPVQLSAFGQHAQNPQVAFDAQGDAVVVWDRYDGSHRIVQASRLKAGGPVWEVPINLSAAGEDATGEQVALDSQGDAIAVWTRRDASGSGRPGIGAPSISRKLEAAGKQPVRARRVGVLPGGGDRSAGQRGRGVVASQWRRRDRASVLAPIGGRGLAAAAGPVRRRRRVVLPAGRDRLRRQRCRDLAERQRRRQHDRVGSQADLERHLVGSA
jgi:hypothetical protein